MSLETHDPTGFGEAVAAALVRPMLRGLLKPMFSARVPVRWQRRWLEAMARLTLPPRRVRFEPATVGGVSGEWARPSTHSPNGADAGAGAATDAHEGGHEAKGIALYLHGGAYCVGSPRTHRAVTGTLARLSGRPVFVPHYRLAPEHPFPAALDDALACFDALQAQGPVLLAGDSAGGGLALATALTLRDRGGPQAAGLWLLSPWADLSMGGTTGGLAGGAEDEAKDEAAELAADDAAIEPPGEAMLSVAWGRQCAGFYRGTAAASHPMCSPLQADLTGLPPVLIQVGTDELLHADSLHLHDALQTAGVPVHCEVAQRRWHVWQLHAGVMPSATDAVRRAAAFARLAWAGGPVFPVPAAGAPRRHQVLVLGAGMSGLCTAIGLKRAGVHDFVVLEQSAGLGGTWWDNRYPGAHVDVPAPLYSFSFEPNPRWRRRFAAAGEIQAYMQHCARRHGVLPHLRLGQAVTEARFDEAAGLWRLRTASGLELEAPFFVCSTGPLNQARWPDIPGLESFTGPRLHSARWDAGVPLAGRRIGVIGTGSTASQLIPPLAQAAGQLHVFQRTANWVLPRMDRPYTALDRWLARLPGVAPLVRGFWYAVLEWGRRGFDEGTLARRSMLGMARQAQGAITDPALRARLQPPYPLGCKRLIYSNDFYPALARASTELVTEGIERITPTGVRTADGRERALDVLVCATGFDTTHLLASLAVRGRGGQLLSETWAAGPEAHRGVTVPGFPNLFLMLGPNTGTGHTSTLLYIEPQVKFAITAMQRVQAAGAKTFEVRAPAFEAHNRALHARLQGSVWSLCRSWYRTDGGRITALWPGFTGEYVRGLRHPAWDEYRTG
jgi:cation diffusion facilitator CzcD-associated flavoprotein CzcO/acetyl esterase/lipase